MKHHWLCYLFGHDYEVEWRHGYAFVVSNYCFRCKHLVW